MTERRTDARRQTLDKKITDLAIGVVGMKGAMEGLAKALQTDVDQVKEQLDKQRRLSKYNRRTHFMVLSWVVVFVLLVSDIGNRYCDTDSGDAWGRTCNVVFWTTEHGGGLEWRIVGLITHLGFLFFFWKRSQVPPELWSEVATAQVKRERDERKRKRRIS